MIAAVPSYEEPYIRVPKVLNKEWHLLASIFYGSTVIESYNSRGPDLKRLEH